MILVTDGEVVRLSLTYHKSKPAELRERVPYCLHRWMGGYDYNQQCTNCQIRHRVVVAEYLLSKVGR